MVQVIGFDPHRHEPAEQGLEHRRVVVDAAQQHGLRHDRDAGAHEPGHGRFRRRRSARADGWRERRPTALFPPAAPRASAGHHAARVDDRDAGMKTDHAEMRDRVERLHDRGESARRQHKRVAAGDDDLPDLRPLANIIIGAFAAPPAPASPASCRRPRGESRSGNRPGRPGSASAAPGRDSDGRCPAPATSVRRRSGRRMLLGAGHQFGPTRHELRRDRIGGLARIDQRRHVLGHRDRIPFRDPPNLVEPTGFDQPGGEEILWTYDPRSNFPRHWKVRPARAGHRLL